MTIFVPTEDWTSNVFTLDESFFGKREFDRLKCITAYVNTGHASVSASLPEIVDPSDQLFLPGKSKQANKDY